MKLNVIYQKDCIQGMKDEIADNSIDLIATDPPYSASGKKIEYKDKQYKSINEEWDTFTPEEYSIFTKDWLTQASRVLKPGGSIYICCSMHSIDTVLREVRLQDLDVRNIITWVKTNPPVNVTRRTYTYSTEFIIFATKGSGYTFNAERLKIINPEKQKDGTLKLMRDVWSMPFCAGHERLKGLDGKTLHQTQKPIRIFEIILEASSNENKIDETDAKNNIYSIVLDPFIGTGTTAEAALKLNRSYIGFELDQKYIDGANSRLAKYAKKIDSVELPKIA